MKIAPAKRAREVLDESGFKKPAIDVNVIAQNHGISVKQASLPDEISGMLHREGNKNAIYVNSEHHSNRQRFTIAHELGHFFLNHIIGVHVDKTAIFRDEESAMAVSPIEMDANRFAAELLMPETMVRTHFQKILSTEKNEDEIIKKIASDFEVSIAAMNYRLQNIGIKLAGF